MNAFTKSKQDPYIVAVADYMEFLRKRKESEKESYKVPKRPSVFMVLDERMGELPYD